MLLGVERAFAGKTAGMRTYALVAMGSALFVIISLIIGEAYIGHTSFDPLRMASQIVTGIGFIGAGLIIFRNRKVSGLTTAAGLWVAAGIGIAVGYGFFAIGLMAALLTLLVFTVVWYIERTIRMLPWSSPDDDDDFE
jgi:putative Mg2+ transporter-C (MgtC) family protein